MIKNVSVLTNYNIPEKAAAAESVIGKFISCGAAVSVPSYAASALKNREKIIFQNGNLYENADLAVIIGGDGSILEAARRAAEREIPILGVNKGRLGYMTELELRDLDLITDVMAGKYTLEKRSMLEVELHSSGRCTYSGIAMNDAVITNGSVSRLIELQLRESGNPVGNYRADGMIVSSPTGSTAYSMSAGGPILDPRLRAICVTPICAHSFAARPIVFPEESVIELKNICLREPNLYLTVDGKINVRVRQGDVVRVFHSEKCANLIRVKENKFFLNLYNKMNSLG